MKIYVVSRNEIEEMLKVEKNFTKKHFFISIFSSELGYGYTSDGEPKTSPLPNGSNICKICFDDVTERDTDPGLIHFSEDMAKKICSFIKRIKDDGSMDFYVHCDAGVSRSGAVGFMLNEWFNKFLKMNRIDNESFLMNNPHILPNPEVMRILKNEMFGDIRSIFVNDYSYNEDGERIDNIKEI